MATVSKFRHADQVSDKSISPCQEVRHYEEDEDRILQQREAHHFGDGVMSFLFGFKINLSGPENN